MKAPEKIYLVNDDLNIKREWYKAKQVGFETTEYTRTDAFIEKACDFIKANIDHYIGHYLNDDDTYLDDSFIEDFQKAMEE